MENEIWKDVINYEGVYQISCLGRVKSLGNNKSRKERILKPGLGGSGYLLVILRVNNIHKTVYVHQLVAIHFLDHIPLGHKIVVDHINDNKLDNKVGNLQIITQRENAFKTQGNYSSKYKGVNYDKNSKKWRASIYFNKKRKHLGLFENELNAYLAYQKKLKEILL